MQVSVAQPVPNSKKLTRAAHLIRAVFLVSAEAFFLKPIESCPDYVGHTVFKAHATIDAEHVVSVPLPSMLPEIKMRVLLHGSCRTILSYMHHLIDLLLFRSG